MTYQLYWGDLHSHCSASYGHGTARQALLRGQQQLDFCSLTGHAFWPDMPTNRGRYAEIIDYHRSGFARLARNWSALLRAQEEASQPGQFLAIPSYEWHSLEYGDHNVYGPGTRLPLRDAATLAELRQAVGPECLLLPHHIGYRSGYRGINWDAFHAEQSPLVEIYSLHGCSLGELAPFPMLHDMGPRDAGSTAEEGWRRGHRFGIMAGTDHHGAYPGSHGDGRMGVFARELTVAGLFEAVRARRVYAATGDRIDARMLVDGAWIGSEIDAPGARRVQIDVQGSDAVDRVELIKNGRVVARFHPVGEPFTAGPPYRLRLTWGWGRRETLTHWRIEISLSQGAIRQIETCFSGQAIVAPKVNAGAPSDPDQKPAWSGAQRLDSPDDLDLPHRLLDRNDAGCVIESVTCGNPSMRQAATQAVSLELDAPLRGARVCLDVNGVRLEYPLELLLQGGQSHFVDGWLSSAIRVGPLVPLAACRVQADWTDHPEREVDQLRLQVAQYNGQWAWLSPVWMRR